MNLDVLWMTLGRVTVTAWVMVRRGEASAIAICFDAGAGDALAADLTIGHWHCTGECKQLILIRRQNKVRFAIRSRKMGNGTRDTIWSDCFKMILLSGMEQVSCEPSRWALWAIISKICLIFKIVAFYTSLCIVRYDYWSDKMHIKKLFQSCMYSKL